MLPDHEPRLCFKLPGVEQVFDPVIHGSSDQSPHKVFLNGHQVHISPPHAHVLTEDVLAFLLKSSDDPLDAESAAVLLGGRFLAVVVFGQGKELLSELVLLVEAEFVDEETGDGVFFLADGVEGLKEGEGLVLNEVGLEVGDLVLFALGFYFMFSQQFHSLCAIPHPQPVIEGCFLLIIPQLFLGINPPLIRKPPHLPQPNPLIDSIGILSPDHLVMPLDMLHPLHGLFQRSFVIFQLAKNVYVSPHCKHQPDIVFIVFMIDRREVEFDSVAVQLGFGFV